MIQLTLVEVAWQVQPMADGATLLQFQDPKSGILVNVPLAPGVVPELRAKLSGLTVARNGDLPRMDVPRG